MNIITRIENRREELGIKRSKMIADLNIPSSTYYTWKKNGTNPDCDYLIPLAKYLKTSVTYILSGVDGDDTKPISLQSNSTSIRVLGRVAAGVPIEAIEDVIGEEPISPKLAETGDYFGLRISGDSMEPAIHYGSIVIVRQQNDVENGDTAIVMIGNRDATCKRIEKFENGIMLIPVNKEYEEKFYTNEEIEKLPVRIIGKVVESRMKL